VVVVFISYIILVVGVSVYSPNPTYSNHTPVVESSPIVMVWGGGGSVYLIAMVVVVFISYILLVVGVSVYSPNPTLTPNTEKTQRLITKV
jgi:hypothetical protein